MFDATNYAGAFASFNLPPLASGLTWDTARLIIDGTIRVVASSAAPILARQPSDQTANVASAVTLSGGAVGTLPISYQWRFNGADLPGQTNSTLTLSNLQETNQGPYHFVARNSSGSITSAPVQINVNQYPVPATDQIVARQNAPVSVPAAKLLPNDTDPDGNGLALASVSATSTNGAAVTLVGGSVTYTPRAGFIGQDRFTYVASDGQSGTAQGVVTVTVTAPNSPLPDYVTISLTPTSATIRFTGTPAQTYVAQAASAVTGPWANLSGATAAGADGAVEFLDTESPRPAIRYYRIMAVP